MGRGPALLAPQCEFVLVFAADPVAPGDVLRCDPQRIRVPHFVHTRVNKTPADGRVEKLLCPREGGRAFAQHIWSAAHRLDAAREENVALVRFDHPRGDVDRFEP